MTTNVRAGDCRVALIAAVAAISLGACGSRAPAQAISSSGTAAAPDAAEETYEVLVARAEAGKPVDFYRLRLAYLESPEFLADLQVPTGVWDQWRLALEQGRSEDLFRLSNEILKITYLDWDAHWTRADSCLLLQRGDCKPYMLSALGLERSTTSSGHDGASCQGAWEVVTEAEISSILALRELTKTGKRDEVTAACVAYEVTDTRGQVQEMYFEIARLKAAMRVRFAPLQKLAAAIDVLTAGELRPGASTGKDGADPSEALAKVAFALSSWAATSPSLYAPCGADENHEMREVALHGIPSMMEALLEDAEWRASSRSPLLLLARAMRHQWNDPAVMVKGAAVAVSVARSVSSAGASGTEDPGAPREAMQPALARLAPDGADVVNLAHSIMRCATRRDATIARDRADELESYYDEYGLPMAAGWLEAEATAYQQLVANLRYRLREAKSAAEVIALFRAQQRAAAVQTQSRLVTSFSFSLARFVTQLEEMDAYVRVYRELLAEQGAGPRSQ